jgi:hypothetical protein
MGNRTWACVDCGKTYRRDQSFDGPVKCAICGDDCEYVHWKIRVPSPKNPKEWKRFWQLYREEKRELERWYRDGSVTAITLDILSMRLQPWRRETGSE